MTTDPISESGMVFGPYSAGDCFYIEKSNTYQSIQSDVKMAEFLLLRSKDSESMIWIIEAKSSSPRPETQPSFNDFIEEICEKLTNALALYLASRLKRHSTWTELPSSFQNLDLEQAKFRLILVINGHKDSWLPPLQDALKQALKPTIKTWNLSPTSVVVLNQTLAQTNGLINKKLSGNKR